MAIKEKDLQTVQQLNDGDFIRVVTANGDSRKVDKDAAGGGSALVCTISPKVGLENTYELNETWKDIYDAYLKGPVIIDDGSLNLVTRVSSSNGSYTVCIVNDWDQANYQMWQTLDENGYPFHTYTE